MTADGRLAEPPASVALPLERTFPGRMAYSLENFTAYFPLPAAPAERQNLT